MKGKNSRREIGSEKYYHLRPTVKRERFFVHVYFSNETVCQTTVTIRPMKMFRLEHETMNVCQLVQSSQLSGKLSRLKSKHVRKNVHASRLNANGSNIHGAKLIRLFRNQSGHDSNLASFVSLRCRCLGIQDKKNAWSRGTRNLWKLINAKKKKKNFHSWIFTPGKWCHIVRKFLMSTYWIAIKLRKKVNSPHWKPQKNCKISYFAGVFFMHLHWFVDMTEIQAKYLSFRVAMYCGNVYWNCPRIDVCNYRRIIAFQPILTQKTPTINGPRRAKRAWTTWHLISSNLHLKSNPRWRKPYGTYIQGAIFTVSIVISGLLSLPSCYLGNEVGKKA